MFENLRADVRYTLKWLLRSPGFTAVAVASLAIGIGFNTALFSIIDALLLRPLPVERPHELVDVYTRGSDGDTYATSSYPDFVDFRNQNQVFTGMLGYSPAIAAVKTSDQSRLALGEVVTGNYFELLGVRAALGRALQPQDDVLGAPRVVMISHHTWTKEYGGDPQAIGRTIRIHGQVYAIVGVAPKGFIGMVPMLQPEMWIPMAWVEEIEPAGIQHGVPSPTGNTRHERRGQRWMFIKARLKDGETAKSAEANLQVIMQQLAAAHPKTNEKTPISVVANVRVHPQADEALRPVAVGLLLGIGLVLLVACANVTNMLLARASGRQREIGIRLAIGAGRGRLIRQLLTESIVLALLGAAAGVGLASLLLRVVSALPTPMPVPVMLALGIDTRVLLYTIGIATIAGLIAGLAPAIRATKPNLAAEMKGDLPVAGAPGRRWSLRDVLVAAQTAVTLVLLVAAGLLTRSIIEARRVDVGFRSAKVAALSVDLGLIGYDEQRSKQLYDRAIERIGAIPGVESAARALRQPLAINYSRNSVFFPDRMKPGDDAIPVSATSVDDKYFETLGIPLLRGRNFNATDIPTAPRTVIVTDSFIRTYWPGDDGVGKRFRLRNAEGPEHQIVGVVGDYKVESIGEKPRPYIHYPMYQRPFTGEVLIARTSGDPAALLGAMRREVLTLEPQAVIIEALTMNAQVEATLVPARMAAQTAMAVGVVAMVLAAIGLYGVIAYAVAKRTREIGIRMALGAAPGGVIGMVMRQGLTVAIAGMAVGLLLAALASRGIASALYGVSAGDPIAWGGAMTLSLMSAAAANFIPARRASKVDPSIALRTE